MLRTAESQPFPKSLVVGEKRSDIRSFCIYPCSSNKQLQGRKSLLLPFRIRGKRIEMWLNGFEEGSAVFGSEAIKHCFVVGFSKFLTDIV
ncbi:hypothetical protein CEXT_672411 [Caerostris extrusa]|uniref:Uncharacterized protein n=1 Tax=Caerostris extrusa TaxID=172846 RepID=A0AAV4P1H2_CAEEX|nr:hypothetical protein CEXT_672411 [Caerostris extrusa]